MVSTSAPRRREGDAVAIAGDYQARALESRFATQRFWHAGKIRLLDRLMPARPDARVADAGCGSGVIAAHMAAVAKEVVGFDANDAAISFARQAYPAPNLRFHLGPFEDLPAHGPFDQIICLEVLEHLYPEQSHAVLRTFAEAAAPGAELFITTPNARSGWPAIEWLLDRSGLVPTLDDAQHLQFFTRATLAAACRQAGWRIVEIGAFHGLAPFVAPLGDGLARRLEGLEFAARRWFPGNLLYCLARRE